MSEIYNNLSLFTDHFLSERLPTTDYWDVDVAEAFATLTDIYRREKEGLQVANESQTEDSFIKPVFTEVLGWHFDSQWEAKHQGRRQVPDFALFESEETLGEAKTLRDDADAFEARVNAVAEAKYWGRDLDGSGGDDAREEWTNRNPSFQITSYMQTTHRDWGILTNGKVWRLYYAHVRSKVQTYYEVDLERILEIERTDEARREFKWFFLFFRAAAHRVDSAGRTSFLEAVYDESEAYAAQLEDRLKYLVFQDIFPTLAEGFLEKGYDESDLSRQELDDIYRGTLRLLYRLLFLLHAESRGLLPVDEDAYRTYSLQQIKLEVAEAIDGQTTLSSVSTDIWNDLKSLFAILDRGDPKLNVPRYNGGLFSSDNLANRFFEDYEIADSYLIPAIDKLARTDDERTDERMFVDYKALDVEQLGSIYEGLLEFRLEFDETGELVLSNDRGERHDTGSFYTPHYVVEYIVENTLRPILDQRRRAFEEAMEEVEKWRGKKSTHPHRLEAARQKAIDSLLDLKVCDPAMGSGHFLVEAVDWLTRHFIEILDDHPNNPILDFIDEIRGDVVESLEAQEVEVDETVLKDINLLKRLVMKRCIFGVDRNPMAVELAKVSLWLDSFTIGAPLSFLDHHLRVGNSLVGSWVDEVTDQMQQDLFGSAFTGMLTATQLLAEVAANTDATIEGVERSTAKFSEYQKAMKPYKVLLDSALGEYFELPEATALLMEQGPKLRKVVKAREKAGEAPDELDERESEVLSRVESQRESVRHFHWELEFPEVFFDLEKSDWMPDPGFDAVIGNPPYIRMEQFKALKHFLQSDYAVHADRMDLYGYFLERALDLLRNDGQMGFIVSNKWLRANYGEPIRELVPRRASVRRLVDFRDLPVFPDATAYPLILIVANGVDDELNGRAVVMQDLEFEDLERVVYRRGAEFSQEQLRNAGWALLGNPGFGLINRLQREHPSLTEFIGSPPLRGIVSGRNEAFVIDSETRDELIDKDPKSGEIIYPLRTGKDVRRYWMRERDTHLIYTYHGVDIDRYPAVEAHLAQYRDALEGRATDQEWYELQQPQEAYREMFEQPKLVQPDFADKVRFCIDSEGLFVRSTVNFLPGKNWYLLGILNSKLANFFLKSTSALYRGETMRLKTQYVEEMPIVAIAQTGSEESCSRHLDTWQRSFQKAVKKFVEQRKQVPERAASELLDSIDEHLAASPRRDDVMRDILGRLAQEMTNLHDRKRKLNLDPVSYVGERTDGPKLADAGTFNPAADPGLLVRTTKTHDKLKIESVEIERSGDSVEVSATVRYKPENPDDFDTDSNGYTETGPFSAFRLTGLDDETASLIEAFVPAATDRRDGLGGYKRGAAKTISPRTRLENIRLPDPSRVVDNLHRFIENRDEARELDRRIKCTDYLIDQIVYRLYDLTDAEIQIVEGNDSFVGDPDMAESDLSSEHSASDRENKA